MLISFLFIPFMLLAQNENEIKTEKLKKEIKLLIENTISENDIPSLSVGLVYNGKTILLDGYGTVKRSSTTKVNENTIYQIASLSKMFTGIIAKNLVLEGHLILENSITTYLPKDLSKKTLKKLKPIKVIDLLLHRSGLPRDSKVVKRKDGEPMLGGYSEKDLLIDLTKLKLKSEKTYRYSNLGYALAGYILERASELTYQELLEKYIIKQYELNNTSADRSIIPNELIATPYRKESRKIKTKSWETGKFISASGIYSNITDLSKILVNQLKAYKFFESKNISNPLVLTETKVSRGNEGSYYGMGLFEDKVQRGILYGHRGDMDGFASEYSFNTKTNTGVILLTSSGGKWIGLLSAQISKILETAE